jgi:hypothetical protein
MATMQSGISQFLDGSKPQQPDRYSTAGPFEKKLILAPTTISYLAAQNSPASLSGPYLTSMGLLFMLVSLLACAYGFEVSVKEKDMAFLSGMQDFAAVFFKTLASRILLLSLYLVFLFSCGAVLIYANGIVTINKYYVLYALTYVLVMNFFLMSGAAVGSLKKRQKRAITLTALLLTLHILIPWTFAYTADGITDTEANVPEQKLIKDIKKYQTFSNIFPSTFFLSTANEISGHGFNTYLEFHSYVESGDAVRYTYSSLPAHFYTAIALSLLYIFGLSLAAFHGCRGKIFPVKQKLADEDNLFIDVKEGRFNILFTADDRVKAKLYNHFAGKEKLKSDITIGKMESSHNIDFLYLFDTVNTPFLKDVEADTLHRFLFGTPRTENMEKWEILFKYAEEKKVIILDGFLNRMPPDKVNALKLRIKEKKLHCLVITSDYYFTLLMVDSAADFFCYKNEPAAAVLIKQLDKKFKTRGRKPGTGNDVRDDKKRGFFIDNRSDVEN